MDEIRRALLGDRAAQEVNLKYCPNCGCRPVLKKKRNKFYYECSGCWTQTSKRWTPKEAADDWNKIESDELEVWGKNDD